MADFTALKTAIQNAIKQNGNEEITGNLLQDVLLAIVTTLGEGNINNLINSLDAEVTARQQAVSAEAQARQLGDSALQGGINTAMQAINAINNAITNGCVYAGIATPSSTPASGKVFYLALIAGTYTNFNSLVVPQGINILKNNGSTWLLDSFLGIDDEPTAGSDNLVKSGGIMKAIGVITDSPYSFSGNGSTFDYRSIGSFNVKGYDSIMIIIGNYERPEGAQEYPFISIRQKDSNNQTIKRDDVNKNLNYIAINENTIEIEIIVALSSSTTSILDGVYKFDKISIYGTIKYDVESLKLKNKYVTPEQYGAVCDGVTDDTNAFQAALDSYSPVFAFGGSYKVREITLHYGNTLYCTNNITGTILVKGSRINLTLNRLHGKIIVGGNDTNGAVAHNIIKFNLIYTPDGQDGITLDGSTYGVENTLIYGGQITNYTASEEKTYMNGIHMISGNDVIEGYTSFCNQNIILAVVAYNALNAGLFMDATATDDRKPAKMDGNIFFNFDAEQCTKGIIMGTYCIGNHFYGLRNNEFGVSDTLLEFGEGCEDNAFYLTKGFFPKNIKCAGPISSEAFNTIYGGLLNLSFGHIWHNPTLFRGELDGEVSLVPQGILPDKLINLQEDTVINYDTRNPNTIANGTIFEGEHTLTLNNSFGENKRTSIKVLAYANKKPTDVFVPKKHRSIVDLEINNKNYSFESHGTTYDYILIEGFIAPTTVRSLYVNSGELKGPDGNQFPLYLRLIDRQNVEISKFLIVSNNTLNFEIPDEVYRIQLQARLSTTSPSIEGTYTANNITIKGNVSAHIVPSETAVEENTLYDIQLTQANYYISKQTVNIGVLK